jgi:hypothetical protein
MELLCVIISGIADRLRGMGGGHIFSLFQGAVIGYLLSLAGLTLVVFSLCWLLGASIGWQTPLGAYWNELPQDSANALWWQVGNLSRPGYEMDALLVRGLLWGMCQLPVIIFIPYLWQIIPVTTLAFWIAPLMLRRFRNATWTDMWGVMEATRGLLMGCGAWFIGSSQ